MQLADIFQWRRAHRPLLVLILLLVWLVDHNFDLLLQLLIFKLIAYDSFNIKWNSAIFLLLLHLGDAAQLLRIRLFRDGAERLVNFTALHFEFNLYL